MKVTKSSGFTLLEVMIVVALIAIIAAIAIPAYSDYVTRARRADAKSALIALQLAQEKIRTNCPFYAQNIGNANVCGANSGATTLVGSTTSPDGYYNLSVEANSASGTSYKLVAAPTGAQNDPQCLNFEVMVSGATELRTNTGTVADADEISTCWQR